MDFDIVKQNLAVSSQNNIQNKVSALSNKNAKEAELKEACEGFEAIFINSMMKSMRQSLPGDALMDESHGMNIYKSMYDQYLSEQASKSNTSIGVKEFLFQQLKNSI